MAKSVHNFSGHHSFSSLQLAELRRIGKVIDDCAPIHVGQFGQVKAIKVDGIEERDANNEQREKKRAQGSETGSRKGSQRSPRRSGLRSSTETHYFSTTAIEQAYGVEFRVLAQQYKALGFEDENGLWIAVKSYPLGNRSPKVFFLIGVPLNQDVAPRAWGFSQIGPNALPLAFKHTNFPDASVCAYTEQDAAWSYSDGLLALVDHYSVWAFKKWHHETIGWWPGPQAGACALYRRREFEGREWCGCLSGKRYFECHQGSDLLLDEQLAEAEFRKYFLVDYENRSVPSCVSKAAQSKWKEMPTLANAFSYRRTPEPIL